jgi:hypothetical protein
MALRTARISRFTSREKRPLRLAAMLTGAALSFPFQAAASDPKAIIQAAGLQELLAEGNAETKPAGEAGEPQEASRRPAEFAGKEGAMALFDGRVVYGKVTNTPGGYLLKRPGATDEMIPTFLVQTASDSLLGCYENLKGAISPTRPDDHLELANWCIRQRLLEEAKTEVLAVLKLDPNRREARELLVKLEEATNPEPRNLDSESAPARTSDGFLDSAGRTTEGLGPELTSQFVRRIQPLMVSKCGNAACHGGNASEQFRLTNIRRTTSSSGRTTTLENMRQVLGLVDVGNADGTRLLSALSSPAHIGVFSGSTGQGQQAALKAWVEGAAAEKGLQPEVQLAGGTPVWTPETIAQVSGMKGDLAAEKRKRMLRANAESPPAQGLQRAKTPPQLRKVSEDAALAEKILHDERPDPFDPDEFNRMVQSRLGEAGARPGR